MSADCVVRAYEVGRKRGLAECPCGANPGAEDLLTYEDGVEDGWRYGARTALGAVLGLLLAAAWLRRRAG
jgi:threonine/homoserine/homoserine lactone efflux protein